MDKQLNLLYSIFKLELSPPFNLVESESASMPFSFKIFDKNSNTIGYYYEKKISLNLGRQDSIVERAKRVFNVEALSETEVCIIVAKHLHNWLQDNFPEKIETVLLFKPGVGRPQSLDYTKL